LSNIEELNIVVDQEFDAVERKDFTNINVSIISNTVESDLDKENDENNAILLVLKNWIVREYVKNLVITILPNLVL
jgi:hypothetical protein